MAVPRPSAAAGCLPSPTRPSAHLKQSFTTAVAGAAALQKAGMQPASHRKKGIAAVALGGGPVSSQKPPTPSRWEAPEGVGEGGFGRLLVGRGLAA